MRPLVSSFTLHMSLTLTIGTTAFLAACAPPPPEVAVTISDFKFEPSKVTVRRAQKTVLRIENRGTVEHTFTIREINLTTGPIVPGQTKTLEITAPRMLKFVCTVPGHEENGMTGEISLTTDPPRR